MINCFIGLERRINNTFLVTALLLLTFGCAPTSAQAQTPAIATKHTTDRYPAANPTQENLECTITAVPVEHLPSSAEPDRFIRKLIRLFKADEWFAKYCDAYGIPILGSVHTSRVAMEQAKYVLWKMFESVPDYRERLAEAGIKLIIYNNLEGELITEIPGIDPKEKDGTYDNEARAIVTWQGDLLCLAGWNEFTIHEIAHALEDIVFDPGWRARRNSAYAEAMNKGLWEGTYSKTNEREYWAEGVTAYFGVYYHVADDEQYGRPWLEASDPLLFHLIDDFFRGYNWKPSCPL